MTWPERLVRVVLAGWALASLATLLYIVWILVRHPDDED